MTTLRTIVATSVLLALAAASGCIYTADFDRSPYVNEEKLSEVQAAKPPIEPDDVSFLRGRPSRPYVVLGTLHAPVIEWTAHYTSDDLIKAMRRKASGLGADAIVGFRTKSTPSIQQIRSYGSTGSTTHAIPYKGLHAWATAIMYVSDEQKQQIESQ